MKGKTYRFIEGDALYPFGYGLSYTKFEYSDAKILEKTEDSIKVSVDVKNIGDRAGIEKTQIYAQYTDSRTYTPHFQLCGIKSTSLEAGETKNVTIDIDTYWIKAVLEDGQRVTPDGKITLYIGGHQPDKVSNELLGYECEKIEL